MIYTSDDLKQIEGEQANQLEIDIGTAQSERNLQAVPYILSLIEKIDKKLELKQFKIDYQWKEVKKKFLYFFRRKVQIRQILLHVILDIDRTEYTDGLGHSDNALNLIKKHYADNYEVIGHIEQKYSDIVRLNIKLIPKDKEKL